MKTAGTKIKNATNGLMGRLILKFYKLYVTTLSKAEWKAALQKNVQHCTSKELRTASASALSYSFTK